MVRRRAHRVGASGVKHRIMGFGNGAHIGFKAQLCADRHHPHHARIQCVLNKRAAIIFEIGEIKVAVAVGNRRVLCHLTPVRGLSRGNMLDFEKRI